MKKVFILYMIAIAIASCNFTNNKNMETTENEKLIKQNFENFNNHDWDKMGNMYTEVAEFKDPSIGKGIVKQTRQQIIAKYSELNKVFPDIHDKVIQTYSSGGKNIIVEFISTGIAPDSSNFELPICTIFTIENGLITKDFTYYDNFEEK
jgi:ketosteroid isomerase-like protein